MFAFVEINFQVDGLFLLVHLGIGKRREIDISQLPVRLAQGFNTLTDFLAIEDVSVLNIEQSAKSLHVRDGFATLESNRAQAVKLAFFNGDRDIHGLTGTGMHERNLQPCPVARIANLGHRILHNNREIAARLVLQAHALSIFVQLAGIVGSGKYVLQKDRVRNAGWLQVLHGAAQGARVHVLVAGELDPPHFYFGAFFHNESDAHCGWRYLPHLSAHVGELAPVLGKQSLENHFRVLHFGGIVLAFLGETDLRQLEPFQDVTGGHRADAQVFDVTNDRAFFHINMQYPALGSLLPLEADVFEISGIPERVEIAFQGCRIVGITGAGKDARLDGFSGDLAVAGDLDIREDILLRHRPGGRQEQKDAHNTPKAQPVANRPDPNSALTHGATRRQASLGNCGGTTGRPPTAFRRGHRRILMKKDGFYLNP